MRWYDRGGEPVQVLAALWADVGYGLAMAVERGGVSLAGASAGRVVWQWRRSADGDCHRWVTVRQAADGSATVDASWLWLCGADSYTGDTPAEALDAAMGRARELMAGMPGRWEETVDGRASVSAGGVVRPAGEADGVAGNPSRVVSPRASVDAAGELPQRTPAVR